MSKGRDMFATTGSGRRPIGRRTKTAAAALAVALPLALTACGGSGGGGNSASGGWEPEKDIEWIVPYTPGGGFDTYSRGIAETMQTVAMPDGTNVVVRNQPPLPQGITAEYTAKPDGYTIGILPMPAAIAQEIQDPDLAKWETEKFTILGSVDENAYVVYVPADSPYETVDDLIAADGLKTVTVEEGSSSALAGQATIEALGLDAKVTYGLEGSAEVVTAMLRGDADFIVYGSTDLVGFVESGDIKPLLFLGTEDQRPEELEWLADTPGAEEAGYPDLAGAVTELRLIVAPPDLPDDVATWLRDALYETMTSDEFKDWATKAERPIVPRDWQDATKVAEEQITAMQELVPQLSN
jgi:tripartite-type tricarboxylate transporter receptor subunit TctC